MCHEWFAKFKWSEVDPDNKLLDNGPPKFGSVDKQSLLDDDSYLINSGTGWETWCESLKFSKYKKIFWKVRKCAPHEFS